jgi:hypothetical protein
MRTSEGDLRLPISGLPIEKAVDEESPPFSVEDQKLKSKMAADGETGLLRNTGREARCEA